MAFVDNTTGGRIILQGITPFKITLGSSASCEVGDMIGYDALADAVWEQADADAKVFATCVAGQVGKASQEITVYKEAVIDLGSGCDATAGDLVYLSDNVGEYASEPGGSWQQAVGMMTTAQIMYVRPMAMPLTVYTLTGVGYGGYFRVEVDADEETPEPHFGGIRIDVKTIASTLPLAADCYGLYIFFQLLEDIPGEGVSMIRLEDGCANGCAPYSFILFNASGADGGPDHFFNLGTAAPSGGCWALTGTSKTGDHGWLKLATASGTRYINLHT